MGRSKRKTVCFYFLFAMWCCLFQGLTLDALADVVADGLRIVSVGKESMAREFIWPVDEKDFFIFQAFGNERKENLFHAGTDFGVYKYDAEIRCIANGWVESIDRGFGNSIMIKHILPDGDVVYSWYNHMADSAGGNFRIGEFVPIGTILGIVGETGFSPSGIHVHLEIKKSNDGQGGYISDLTRHYNAFEFILSRLTFNSDPPEQCTDHTLVGECSTNKPYHCINGGILVENSLVCGCDTGGLQPDGSCSHGEEGIIVDNKDIGFESSGSWHRSTSIMGFYGSDYLTADPGNGESTASWTPDIPENGFYSVYGWWRDRFSEQPSFRAARAPITIHHAGQQDQAEVDFTDYKKGWKYIGTYFFEKGTGNHIVLSNIPDGIVVADAFGFVRYIIPPPVSDFKGGPASGIAPLRVYFTDAGTGQIDEWLWNFGDGSTSNNQNPSHEYTAPGIYSVSLKVTGPGGTNIKTIKDCVNVLPPPPVVGFTSDSVSGIVPLNVSFSDQSTGEIDEWRWDFGDGNTSDDQNPGHEYTEPGIYSVSLEVTGPGGRDSVTTKGYLTVLPTPPVAGFTSELTAGNIPLIISFRDKSTGEIDEWRWDFGDGNTSDDQNPGHEYTMPGVYSVSLKVTGSGGTDTITIEDYIQALHQPPMAGFTSNLTSGAVPLNVTFSDTSTGEIDEWRWDFGDGNTSAEQNPVHEYMEPGIYSVKLEVAGPGGGDALIIEELIEVDSEETPSGDNGGGGGCFVSSAGL